MSGTIPELQALDETDIRNFFKLHHLYTPDQDEEDSINEIIEQTGGLYMRVLEELERRVADRRIRQRSGRLTIIKKKRVPTSNH